MSYGAAHVRLMLLHPRAQGRFAGLSVSFPRLLGQGQSSWFPTAYLILIYRYKRDQSVQVWDAEALVELHQHGLQKMKEQPSLRFTETPPPRFSQTGT